MTGSLDSEAKVATHYSAIASFEPKVVNFEPAGYSLKQAKQRSLSRPHHARGQAVPRPDLPSGPRGPPRLCQPGRPLELPPVGSPEAGGGG
jgi:hypothetical protein